MNQKTIRSLLVMGICLLAALQVPLTVFGASDTDSLPLAAGICINKAQTAAGNGDFPGAVRILEDFKAKQKGKVHYYVDFLAATYYLSLSQAAPDGSVKCKTLLKKAAAGFRAAVAQNPGFYQAWLNLANCLYASDNYAAAAQAFVKGYETAENRQAVYLYYAAVCRFQADEPKPALDIFNRLRKNHPKAVTYTWKETLVHILFSLERYKQALPVLEDLARQPDKEKRIKWQEILLQQYLALKMNKKALDYAQKLNAGDPLEPKWWKALCHIRLNLDQTRQGLTALVVYGYLKPWNRQETLLAADLYLSLDVPSKAAAIYEDALQAEAQLSQIRKTCQAHLLAHDHEKALAWIEKGLALKKDKELLRMKTYIHQLKAALEPAAALNLSLN